MTTRDLFTLRMFLIVSELLLPFCFFFTHTSSTEIYTLALHDSLFFFFNDPATPDISPLPLHDPLPISHSSSPLWPPAASTPRLRPRKETSNRRTRRAARLPPHLVPESLRSTAWIPRGGA